MGLLSRLFGKKDVPGSEEDDAPEPAAPERETSVSSRTTGRTRRFSLSTGQVLRDPAETAPKPARGAEEPGAAPPSNSLPWPESPPDGGDPSETIPFEDLPPDIDSLPPADPAAAPASAAAFRDTRRLSVADGLPQEITAQTSSRAAAASLKTGVTARLAAVGKLTPEETDEMKRTISPSLRAAAAGSAVSHKRRVSARNKTLGALLIADGLASEDAVEEALAHQARHGGLLGQILVEQGICQHDAVGEAIKKQRTITTVTLGKTAVDPDLPKILAKDFCMKHRLLPFERYGNMLCLAMSNVLDTQAKNLVRERSNMTLKPFDVEWNDLAEAIANAFAPPGALSAARKVRATTTIESGAVSEALAAAATVGATGELILLPLPAGRLNALPMSEAFVSEVVQWDAADPERRWMATQLADNPLPLLPCVS